MTDEKEKDIYKFFFTNNLNTDYLKTGSQIFILLNFMYNFEKKKTTFSITSTHILNSQGRADKKVFKYSPIYLFAFYYCS